MTTFYLGSPHDLLNNRLSNLVICKFLRKMIRNNNHIFNRFI